MVKLAILAAGRIGGVHTRNAAAHRALDLVAISDPVAASAKSLAEQTGAAVESVDTVLADARGKKGMTASFLAAACAGCRIWSSAKAEVMTVARVKRMLFSSLLPLR